MVVLGAATCVKATLSRRMSGSRTYASSTSTRMKAYAPSVEEFGKTEERKLKVKGEYVPVYVALGMIIMSMTFAVHTAKQQLMHSPGVYVKKSKRETLPEVVNPDEVADHAEKFIRNSFFRKVAHIQDFQHPLFPNPVNRDVLARPTRVETLKSVGVDLQHH